MKKVLIFIGKTILLLTAALICYVAAAVFADLVLFEKAPAPSGWLFGEPTSLIFFSLFTILPFYGCANLLDNVLFARKKKNDDMIIDYNRRRRQRKKKKSHLIKWIAFLLAMILSGYLTCTSRAYVTEDQIYVYDPLHPQGTVYDYEDVQKITTGFDKRGNFFYKLTLDSGDHKTTVKFDSPEGNPQYYEEVSDSDHYFQEILDFDQALLQLGVEKEVSSPDYSSRASLGEDYFERLEKIINE